MSINQTPIFWKECVRTLDTNLGSMNGIHVQSYGIFQEGVDLIPLRDGVSKGELECFQINSAADLTMSN